MAATAPSPFTSANASNGATDVSVSLASPAVRAAARTAVTCQMFETPLIERFSRIHPTHPFLFWIPTLAYFAVHAVRNAVAIPAALGLFLIGALIWSFTEYVLHRWAFHYTGPRLWQRRMFFILHGVHHDFPSDASRLLMPLGVSIPIGALSYLAFRAAIGSVLVDPMFIGFVVGYLAYDGTHYAVHHLRMTSRLGKWLKRYHLVHHYTGEQARWGVSSPLWDWVFGTLTDPRGEHRERAPR